MDAVAVEGFNVDGELESLLGMFNFDQCSSEERSLGFSSLSNDDDDDHHLQLETSHDDHEDVFCSDPLLIQDTPFNDLDGVLDQDNRVFPFVAMLRANSSSYDPIQETAVKRKLDVTDLSARNLDETEPSDLVEKNRSKSRTALVKSNKKRKLSQNNYNDILSNYNSSSDDERSLREANDATNSKGKGRANKGTTNDPQSLYARKRREKINERLRILQSLVPNGTKVDISTMLEEAVHYVKFMQLQIRLLSSDDMWMYAPLAYNGLDMGLHQKLLSRLM